MAEEEPILMEPGSPEMTKHVRDYERFITLFKWGAIISFFTAFFVLWLIA